MIFSSALLTMEAQDSAMTCDAPGAAPRCFRASCYSLLREKVGYLALLEGAAEECLCLGALSSYEVFALSAHPTLAATSRYSGEWDLSAPATGIRHFGRHFSPHATLGGIQLATALGSLTQHTF